ncbi:transposase [Variovorax sp. YR216]
MSDVCRQIGVSEATYYTWKKKRRRPLAHRSLEPDALMGL